MRKTKIDLTEKVEDFKYDPLVRVEPSGSLIRFLQPCTKKDLLKAVIPILEEIYNTPVDPAYSYYETKDFIDYIKALTNETNNND